MAELREDEKEGRASEKYNAKGSKVEAEAMDEDDGKKHGGRAKKAAGGPIVLQQGGPIALKRGGGVHHGSMPMHVDGKAPRHHRMDRMPGRKRGGGIGADTSPMTAAARLTAPSGASMQTRTDKRDD